MKIYEAVIANGEANGEMCCALWSGPMKVGYERVTLTFWTGPMKIYEAVLGPEYPSFATICNNLATLCHTQGRYAETEPLFRRAIEIVLSKL